MLFGLLLMVIDARRSLIDPLLRFLVFTPRTRNHWWNRLHSSESVIIRNCFVFFLSPLLFTLDYIVRHLTLYHTRFDSLHYQLRVFYWLFWHWTMIIHTQQHKQVVGSRLICTRAPHLMSSRVGGRGREFTLLSLSAFLSFLATLAACSAPNRCSSCRLGRKVCGSTNFLTKQTVHLCRCMEREETRERKKEKKYYTLSTRMRSGKRRGK